MNLLDYGSLFAVVIAGAAAGLYAPGLRDRPLHLLLSFSGAYLLSITAVHLIPDAFEGADSRVGLALLGGFFLQVMFEQLSTGVEHGHIHAHPGAKGAIPILIGLSLHAFLEGSPLALVEDKIHVGHDHNHLLTGILLHKLPAAFALAVVLRVSGYRNIQIWIMVLLFASMSPLGSVLAERLVPVGAIPYLLGLAIGSLLHVSTTILFESDDKRQHRLTPVKILSIVVGIITALLTAYV